MNVRFPEPISALQLFEPSPDVVYSIEQTARLAHVSRRLIAIYARYGLVLPAVDPDTGVWFFNDEAIRTLKRVEQLRNSTGMSMTAAKLVFELIGEVEHLRREVRFLREL
jgi:DNA-binding transcriptional MerR regulator